MSKPPIKDNCDIRIDRIEAFQHKSSGMWIYQRLWQRGHESMSETSEAIYGSRSEAFHAAVLGYEDWMSSISDFADLAEQLTAEYPK